MLSPDPEFVAWWGNSPSWPKALRKLLQFIPVASYLNWLIGHPGISGVQRRPKCSLVSSLQTAGREGMTKKPFYSPYDTRGVSTCALDLIRLP